MAAADFACAMASVGRRAMVETTAIAEASATSLDDLILDLPATSQRIFFRDDELKKGVELGQV
jgi:hypothetical protein